VPTEKAAGVCLDGNLNKNNEYGNMNDKSGNSPEDDGNINENL